MKKFLKEPLLHFVLIGALIFFINSFLGRSGGSSKDITITKAQIQSLVEGWARVWKRPPTAEEYTGLLEDYIQEEVFVREAMSMRLGEDDPVIRRRLRQKMEFVSDDLSTLVEPTDDELKEFYLAHKEKFQIPSKVSFDQKSLNGISLLPTTNNRVSKIEVEAQFGDGFFDQIVALPLNTWSTPIQSGYGDHAVYVREIFVADEMPFDDVKNFVKQEWMIDRQRKEKEMMVKQLRSKYNITIEAYP